MVRLKYCSVHVPVLLLLLLVIALVQAGGLVAAGRDRASSSSSIRGNGYSFSPPAQEHFHHGQGNNNDLSYSHGEAATATTTTSFPCEGVCMNIGTCMTLGGIPKQPCTSLTPSMTNTVKNYCCHFETSCQTASKDDVFHYHSPNYPAPVVGNLLCHHQVIIQPGVCGVRLEFIDFNITSPLERGLCHMDQFLIINSLDGPAFPRCGQLTSYATVVPVDARYRIPLILLQIIQSSKETFKWNIKVSQIKCESTKKIRDYPGCGKNFNSPDLITTSTVEDPNDNFIEDVGFERLHHHQHHRSSPEDFTSPRDNFLQDNAFYIEYLKQSYQALVPDGPEPNPNNTYCNNKPNTTTTTPTASGSSGGVGTGSTVTFVDPSMKQRIIRGHDAALYEFPWQISIQDSKGHVCGGAIINEYYIISAAHCFMSVKPITLSKLKISIGDLNMNTTTETEHLERTVESVTFHSHFDPFYLTNDIALIRVNQKMYFRKGVQPICLPETGNSYVGRKAIVSGWGATHYPQGKISQRLQRVENDIIETEECKRVLKTTSIFPTMMCALSPKCSGTCFGDSGGPLIVSDKETGSSRIIGIVSFGIGGCALLPYWPDIYTRVSEYIDWLSYAVK